MFHTGFWGGGLGFRPQDGVFTKLTSCFQNSREREKPGLERGRQRGLAYPNHLQPPLYETLLPPVLDKPVNHIINQITNQMTLTGSDELIFPPVRPGTMEIIKWINMCCYLFVFLHTYPCGSSF